MAIRYRTGDLFDQDVPALAHGVNCQGSMGGIAGAFARRWPDLASAYAAECAAGRLRLGDVLVWTSDDGTVVYNLATQWRGGPNADLDAIEASLSDAVAHAERHGIDAIGLPRIGAGIGGLAWEAVRGVLEAVARATAVDLVVVTLPGVEQP